MVCVLIINLLIRVIIDEALSILPCSCKRFLNELPECSSGWVAISLHVHRLLHAYGEELFLLVSEVFDGKEIIGIL